MLGVPTDVENQDGSPGQDTIQFNAHRWLFDRWWCEKSFQIWADFLVCILIILWYGTVQGFMGPDFILTSPPTGNLSGQTQEKGESSTIHFGGSVRIAIVSGTSSVQGKSPGWGGQQMALEASPTLATPTRFHIQQGLKQYFYLQWKDSIMISLMIPLSAWSWSLLNFSRCQKIHLTEEYDICNKNFNINEYLNIFV